MNSFDYFFENTHSLEKPFVTGPKETITYRDLYRRCLTFATWLNNTFGTGQNVLLIGPNSVFLITAYLSILKSNNVAVPLNPEIEQSNLDFIREKCRPVLIITTAQLATKLDFKGVPVLNEVELNTRLPAFAEATAGAATDN